MDQDIFVAVIQYLQDEDGLVFPHGKFPGSLPGLDINIAESRALYDSYVWGGPGDPHGPSFFQEGTIVEAGPWSEPSAVRREAFSDPDYQDAYKPSPNTPLSLIHI